MKKLLILLITAAMICSTAVSSSAESVSDISPVSISIDYSDHSIDISGSSGAGYKFRNVSLQVVNPGKDFGDILTGEDVLNWSDQSKTDAQGSYSFSYKITGETGTYTAIIGIDGHPDTFKAQFEYFCRNDVNSLVSDIADYIKDKDEESIASVILNKAPILQIDNSSYSELPSDNQELVCLGIIELKPESLNDFKEDFEDCVAVQETNLISDEQDYIASIKELVPEKSAAVNTIFDTLNPETGDSIITEMMAYDYKTKKALIDDYTDKVFLSKIDTINLWGEMESFIKTIKDMLGIDLGAYNKLEDKSNAMKYMLDADIRSTGDIKTAFNDAVAKAEDDESSSSGTGGSGGGGGGGSSGGSYKTAPSAAPVIPNADNAPADIFSDISQAQWARDSIVRLNEMNIISGYSDRTFRPNNNVTRAEFLKMTVMLFNIKADGNTANKFEDVKATDWHYEYVCAALSEGIVSGISETEFNPDGLISRQDMAVILYRAATASGKAFEGGEITFADKDSISGYAQEAVSAFSKAGIINGYNNMFNPASTATRAEAAQILFNILQKG